MLFCAVSTRHKRPSDWGHWLGQNGEANRAEGRVGWWTATRLVAIAMFIYLWAFYTASAQTHSQDSHTRTLTRQDPYRGALWGNLSGNYVNFSVIFRRFLQPGLGSVWFRFHLVALVRHVLKSGTAALAAPLPGHCCGGGQKFNCCFVGGPCQRSFCVCA